MELKQILTDKILANFYQPRTRFDRENIKELAESILSNGLINPITITPDKKRKGKFMIVSGERRWQAHKVAELKTIQAIVKTYSSDGQFMVESLIENIHREDLTDVEKAKFLKRIMKEEGIVEYKQLSKRIGGISDNTISYLFDTAKIRTISGPETKGVSYSTITETRGLPEKQRIELIKQAAQEDFGSREMRKRVSEIKSGERPEPIRLEETINDTADELLSVLHRFDYLVDEFKKDNLNDLKKPKADKLMTTIGLHTKTFETLVNLLRKRGATPHPLILALMKAKNGKR